MFRVTPACPVQPESSSVCQVVGVGAVCADAYLDARRAAVEPYLDRHRWVPIVDVMALGAGLVGPGLKPRPLGHCRVLAGDTGLIAVDVELAPGARIDGDLAPVFTVDDQLRVSGLLEVFFTTARLRPEPEPP